MVETRVVERERQGVELGVELARFAVLQRVKPFLLHQMDRKIADGQLLVAQQALQVTHRQQWVNLCLFVLLLLSVGRGCLGSAAVTMARERNGMGSDEKSWYFLLRVACLTCHYSNRKVLKTQLQIGKQVGHQHVDELNKKQTKSTTLNQITN